MPAPPSEFEKRLKDLEVNIDRLRSLYEQYFRGIEKMPPIVLQKRVERELRELRKTRHRNTALRFRLQMQVQKYTTYLTYWQRILRLLEFGQLRRTPGGLVPHRGGALPAAPAGPAALDIPDVPETPARGGDELLDIDIEIDI